MLNCPSRNPQSFLRSAWRGEDVLIPEEIASFLPSGLSIALACRDGELRPHGAHAWAAVVDPDRTHLTVFIPSKGARPLLRELEAHPVASVLFVRPTDDRACQLKGTLVSSRPARPAERPEVERQVQGFVSGLETIGITRALTAGWSSWPCVALRIRVTELYHQTPGPGAGAPIP